MRPQREQESATNSEMAASKQVQPGAGRAVGSEDAQRLRHRFAWLQRFTDLEIQEISFCEPGAAIRAGETYFDISHPEEGSFTADRDMTVDEGRCLVAKSAVSPRVWSKVSKYP